MKPLVSLLLLSCCGAEPLAINSEACGNCHVAQRDAWASSSHARSGTTPVFSALLPRVELSWGHQARARCETCHSPAHGDAHGIGCASCHLAIGNRGTENSALEVRLDGPISTVRAVNAPHGTTQRAFLRSADLCGTCHDVRGPGLLDEPTFTEYLATDPESGTTCVTCHFGAGHRLEVKAGLTLEQTDVMVRVRNDGARHRIPTGMAALRDIWVDVTLEDGHGHRTDVSRVIELGAELDAPVFTEATFIRPRGLQFGEARGWSAPSGSRVVDARIQRRRVRAAASQALGLE